jgi:transketolase
VLSRQELPVIDRDRYAPAAGLHQGAYVLAEASGGEPELILLTTGSEVWRALAALHREHIERAWMLRNLSA